MIHLVAVVGNLRVSDCRPIRRHGHARRRFVHADYLRRTPLGGWLARRRWLVPFALRTGVQVSRWHPWTGPVMMLRRFVIRPIILLLAALRGLDVVRGWFAGIVE